MVTMTTHIHSYSLQAFPTEKILKEFKPVRGMRFAGPIDIPAEDRAVLRKTAVNRYLDRKSWLGARLVPDVVPVFQLIADKMGYDLPSLIEGKGETGKPTDTWTTYADEGKTPMLVRWTIGEAQLLLSLVIGDENIDPNLAVLLLADKKAQAHLEGIGEALRSLEEEYTMQGHVDVADGNVLTRYLSNGNFCADFSIRCRINVDPTQPLSQGRLADLAALRNSAQVILDEGHNNAGLRPGEMLIFHTKGMFRKRWYAADESISREFLEILHDESVLDVEQEMEKAFSTHFALQREIADGVTEVGRDEEATPTIDLELTERQARLSLLINELEGFSPGPRSMSRYQETFRGRQSTLGRAFRICPGSVLRGTGPDLKMEGGDVTYSHDLIGILPMALCDLPERYPAKGKHRAKVQVSASLEAPAVATGYKDNAPFRSKFSAITNPFYASHNGLPVRVDKSVAVWREGYDTEALAADFFYAPETKDLHIANLYRVKIPKG